MPSNLPLRKTDTRGLQEGADRNKYIVAADINGLIDHVAGWVNAKSYGLAHDASPSYNAGALSDAIADALEGGGNLTIPCAPPGTRYRFTNLVLPPGNGKALHIVGGGASDDYAAANPSASQRTILEATDTTAPAISLSGSPGYTARQVRIEGLTLVADTTAPVIQIGQGNTGTQLRDLLVQQNGTGHGIDWTDAWVNVGLSSVVVQSGSSSVASGSVGLRMRNTIPAGSVFAEKVIVQKKYGGTGGFDIGMQFGALPGEAAYAATIDALDLRLLTCQECNTGMVLGGGVKAASVLAPHFEFNALRAMRITYGASTIAVRNGFFFQPAAADADILIDGDSSPSNGQHAIEIVGNHFAGVFNYAVDFVNAAYTSGRLAGNWFERYGSGAGVAIRTRGNLTPWSSEDNVFSGITDYDDPFTLSRRADPVGNLWLRATLAAKGAVIGTDGVNVNSGAATIASDGRGAFSRLLVGASSTVWSNSGVPTNDSGTDGDVYFRKDGAAAGQHIYKKVAGAWAGIA